MNNPKQEQKESQLKMIFEKFDSYCDDIIKKTDLANKIEFKVCEFILNWTIACFGFYGGFLILLKSEINLNFWILIPFITLGLSLVCGLYHFWEFRNRLNKEAENFSETIKTSMQQLSQNIELVDIILNRLLADEKEKPSIHQGLLFTLYGQVGLFCLSTIYILFILIRT